MTATKKALMILSQADRVQGFLHMNHSPRQEPSGRSGERERELHTSPVMIIPGVRSLSAAKSSGDEFPDKV